MFECQKCKMFWISEVNVSERTFRISFRISERLYKYVTTLRLTKSINTSSKSNSIALMLAYGASSISRFLFLFLFCFLFFVVFCFFVFVLFCFVFVFLFVCSHGMLVNSKLTVMHCQSKTSSIVLKKSDHLILFKNCWDKIVVSRTLQWTHFQWIYSRTYIYICTFCNISYLIASIGLSWIFKIWVRSTRTVHTNISCHTYVWTSVRFAHYCHNSYLQD